MKISIAGGNGQHGKDLINRGVFDGMQIDKLSEGESILPGNHVVVIHIARTSELLKRILATTGVEDIINLAGVMATTPDCGSVTNMHFLFGPETQENLKVAVAGNQSKTTEKIITNSKKSKVRVIETSIEEHDKKMAIIQGFANLLILLSGERQLMPQWKTTESTICDMILHNPYFVELLKSLKINQGMNFSQVFLDMVATELTDSNIQNFGTPNFHRIRKFFKDNEFILGEEAMIFFEKLLGQPNRAMILERIRKLRTPSN